MFTILIPIFHNGCNNVISVRETYNMHVIYYMYCLVLLHYADLLNTRAVFYSLTNNNNGDAFSIIF